MDQLNFFEYWDFIKKLQYIDSGEKGGDGGSGIHFMEYYFNAHKINFTACEFENYSETTNRSVLYLIKRH